jgi:hypothetical protein
MLPLYHAVHDPDLVLNKKEILPPVLRISLHLLDEDGLFYHEDLFLEPEEEFLFC